jgi:Omp85 superfamily domain
MLSVVVVLVMAGLGAPASAPATHRVAAGPQYGAGWCHRFVLGSGYRALWTTPIEADVLEIDSFSGGLVARKKGGGKQTRNLTLEGADGRKWKFRSVDKDPTSALPEALQNSFVDKLAQDQISASLPANAPVVDRLTDAVGILHVDRRVVVLPDSARLGEFRDEFKGMLGTLEEDPSVEPPVTPGFSGYSRIVETDELEKAMDADARERVDARALLRARLLDLVIGDYDRHRDQWDWAKDAQSGLWVPVPKDRDLAFVRFDGLLLDVIRGSVPRLVDFEERYPSILGLTWQARFLDRRHLAELAWPDWSEAARVVQERLTDAVIDEAARRLPEAYYALEGEALAATLKARRERLPDAARRFYELLAREAEVHATDEADALQVLRQRDGSVEIVLAASGGPYFRRRYGPSETSEVRVFLKGGDDRAISEGDGSPGVKARVVGGEGNDVLDDSAGGHTRFYDSNGQNRVVGGPGTRESARPYTAPLDASGNPERDWGAEMRFLPWVRAGADYGVILGGQLNRTGYGFRKHPYAHQHRLRAGYSTELETGGVRYDYESLRTDNRTRFEVMAKATALELIHYYGFGNETSDHGGDAIYDVLQNQYVLAPSYRLELSAMDVFVGPVVKYAHTRLSTGTLVAQERPYGSEGFGQAGIRLGFDLDRRNRRSVPSSGFRIEAEGSYYPAVWSVEEDFGAVHAVATSYMPVPLPLEPVFAFRVGGARAWGRYPFQEAATIGGTESVRGLRRQRYTGDGSLYGSAELRLRLFHHEGTLPLRLGVFGLTDAGRVFFSGESSERWHTALGGGLWVSVVKPENTASLAFAHSEGHLRLYFQAGFTF